MLSGAVASELAVRLWRGGLTAAVLPAGVGVATGKGFHSSTSQLNLSQFGQRAVLSPYRNHPMHATKRALR